MSLIEIVVVLIVVFLIIVRCFQGFNTQTKTTIKAKVNKKYTITDEYSLFFIDVITDENIFMTLKNEDIYFLKSNADLIYSEIKSDTWYEFQLIGERNYKTGDFPNILSVKKIK